MYRKVKTAMAVFGCVTAALVLFTHSVSASAANGKLNAPVAEERQSSDTGGAAQDSGTEKNGTGSGTEDKATGSGTQEKARTAAELIEGVDWNEMAAAKVKSYVNVRKKASQKSKVVGILQKGHAVKVVGTKGSWTKITSGKIKGYIKSKYLVFGKKARKTYMKDVGVTGTVTAKKLVIREEASKKADKLGSKKKGTQVKLKGLENGWYEISHEKDSGYVLAKYVTVDKLQGAITVKAFKKSQEKETGCTAKELDMLAAIIECEAGGEKRVGKVAVGAVVLNRVRSKKFPNTIAKVIKQKGQFSPVRSGKFARVLARGARKDCYEAARAALKGENPVGNALFFSAGRGKGKQIGNQHFH